MASIKTMAVYGSTVLFLTVTLLASRFTVLSIIKALESREESILVLTFALLYIAIWLLFMIIGMCIIVGIFVIAHANKKDTLLGLIQEFFIKFKIYFENTESLIIALLIIVMLMVFAATYLAHSVVLNSAVAAPVLEAAFEVVERLHVLTCIPISLFVLFTIVMQK